MADDRTRWIVLLGSLISFPVVFGLVLLLSGVPRGSRTHVYRPRIQQTPPLSAAHPSPARAPAGTTNSGPSSPTGPSRPATVSPSAPPRGVPPATAAAAPSAKPESAPQEGVPPLDIEPETARRLAALKQRYTRRIGELAEYRDAQIELLARGLAELPPAEAAAVVGELDDELVAQALLRLENAPRRAILASFSTPRMRRIQERLRQLTEKGP